MSRRSPESLPTLPEIAALAPWYHDFSRLGLKTVFEPAAPGLLGALRHLARGAARRLSPGPVAKGERLLSRATLLGHARSHRVNQPLKEAFLGPLLERALARLGGRGTALDLFCADGYYSCLLAQRAPGLEVTGVDLDATEIDRARAAARALGLGNARFLAADVLDFVAAGGSWDLVLCAGGLYHLRQPQQLLAALRRLAPRALVVQSVVSLEREEPGYFETPAPGWTHGSRFSHARLASWLEELGWRLEVSERNELAGNRRQRDRGSSYFLCSLPAPAPAADAGAPAGDPR